MSEETACVDDDDIDFTIFTAAAEFEDDMIAVDSFTKLSAARRRIASGSDLVGSALLLVDVVDCRCSS